MMQDRIFRGLAILMTLAVIGIAFEVYVRFGVDNGMRFDLEMWKYARSLKQVAVNPAIGHEHRPGASARLMGVEVRINQHKLRDQERAYERGSDIQRVLMLGDSITLGWGVPEEDTVSKRLERYLRESGKNVQVINTGVGNYNTGMEVEYFLSEGFQYDPQVVVLNYFINDAEPTPTYKPLNILERHSFAYIWLKGRLDVAARQWGRRQNWWEYYLGLYQNDGLSGGKGDRSGWKAAEEEIAKLATYCHRHGIALLIVNYPELRELKHYRFDRVRSMVRETALRNRVAYIDLYDVVRNEQESRLWVTKPDPHPNSYADKLFADAMGTTVAELLTRDLYDQSRVVSHNAKAQ
jgi:lysophospholipase L1-like esterase